MHVLIFNVSLYNYLMQLKINFTRDIIYTPIKKVGLNKIC